MFLNALSKTAWFNVSHTKLVNFFRKQIKFHLILVGKFHSMETFFIPVVYRLRYGALSYISPAAHWIGFTSIVILVYFDHHCLLLLFLFSFLFSLKHRNFHVTLVRLYLLAKKLVLNLFQVKCIYRFSNCHELISAFFLCFDVLDQR